MTEKEVQEIYNRLLELTKAGAIRWKRTEEEEFVTSFPRASVAIGKVRAISEQVTVMWIYNEDGILIARAFPKNLDAGEEGVKQFTLDPAELFSLVQDKVYKYSETSENILDELRKLKAS